VPRTRRILVVDDEANARNALAELLSDEDFEVDTASHGFEALAKVAAVSPHVAIVDLHMPGMDAVELISKLQQAPERPAVIAMSSFGDTATALRAMRAGASDYVTKPIRFDELLVVLAKVIRLNDLERELDRLREAAAYAK
jgi:DNA-binding response OmpR family regulator